MKFIILPFMAFSALNKGSILTNAEENKSKGTLARRRLRKDSEALQATASKPNKPNSVKPALRVDSSAFAGGDINTTTATTSLSYDLLGGSFSFSYGHNWYAKSGKSSKSSKSEKEPIFTPAKPLSFFKNVDPAEFEWMNKDEIKAGEATCGFLHADLGTTPGVAYPKVKVYTCVRFAKVQPAPRGNLAVHCGGPGSLSDCVYSMGDLLDEDTRATYNVIAFDQRGIGRSEPSFMVEECTNTAYGVNYNINRDYSDEKELLEFASQIKNRNLGCWKYGGFLMDIPVTPVSTINGTSVIDQSIDQSTQYHFLEYSGSRQLAEDIERVRVIFGDDKLSIYGISYGTKPMGAYATMYPHKVRLMVLDSNIDPNVDILENAEDDARHQNHRLNYFIAVCSEEVFNSPGGKTPCNIKDPRGCVSDLNTLVYNNFDAINAGAPAWSSAHEGIMMTTAIQHLYENPGIGAEMLCDIAKKGDVNGLITWVNTYYPVMIEPDMITPDDVNTISKPTRCCGGTNDFVFGNPGYNAIDKSGTIPQNLVYAQDYTMGAYDQDEFVKTFLRLNEKYPGAGTQLPVRQIRQWYSTNYYWPVTTSLSPLGHPYVTGIISGQLYDPFTPYIWTQKMRENFKSASLLTSRSFNHGIESALDGPKAGLKDPACHDHIKRYFKTGVVDFVDGDTCRSALPGDTCTIQDIVTGGRCSSE